MKTGLEALRYTFTFTLWQPDKECTSNQHTWNAAIVPAWGASVVSWSALALAAGPAIAARLAPIASRLAPTTVAPLSMLVVEDASNPEGETQEINISESLCNILQELKEKYNGNLALGLGEYLENFAGEDYASYLTWNKEPLMQTQEGIKILMDNASEIHFNMEGFDLNEFSNYLLNGDYSKITTNWELKTIIENPVLYNKLTLHN